MINGMNLELARKYITVMDQIEEIVDKIHAVAYLMSLLSGPMKEKRASDPFH